MLNLKFIKYLNKLSKKIINNVNQLVKYWKIKLNYSITKFKWKINLILKLILIIVKKHSSKKNLFETLVFNNKINLRINVIDKNIKINDNLIINRN